MGPKYNLEVGSALVRVSVKLKRRKKNTIQGCDLCLISNGRLSVGERVPDRTIKRNMWKKTIIAGRLLLVTFKTYKKEFRKERKHISTT